MNLLKLLTTYNYPDKVRLGNLSDGGYVIAKIPGGYDVYISAGVGDDASFCAAFIDTYKTEKNYACDGTITELPKNFPNRLVFVKKNIGVTDNNYETTLTQELSQGKDVFLKMDIEGGEVAWLNYLPSHYLMNIKQMVIEMHGITDDSWGSLFTEKIAALEKITQNHRLVHIHGNNCGPMSQYDNVPVPAVIELTLVRSTDLDEPSTYNQQQLPIRGIDFPNNADLPDYDMNHPPFVFNTEYESLKR